MPKRKTKLPSAKSVINADTVSNHPATQTRQSPSNDQSDHSQSNIITRMNYAKENDSPTTIAGRVSQRRQSGLILQQNLQQHGNTVADTTSRTKRKKRAPATKQSEDIQQQSTAHATSLAEDFPAAMPDQSFSVLQDTFDKLLQAIYEDYSSFCQPAFENSTAAECRMRLNVLNNRIERLKDIKFQLDDQPNKDSSIDFLYDDILDTANAAKTALIDRINHLASGANYVSGPSDQQAMQSGVIANGHPQIFRIEFDPTQMMHSVKLPEFDGNPAKWKEFKSTFETKVHNNHKMHNIDKFLKLKQCVVGSAAATLGNWLITEESYQKAWQKLCNVFDNDYLIMRAHLNDIFGIKQMQHATHANLRHLADTVSNATQQLQILEANTAELMLIHLMESKLDSESRAKWDMDRNPNIIPTLDEFFGFLDTRSKMLLNQESQFGSDSNMNAQKHTANTRFQPYDRYQRPNVQLRAKNSNPFARSSNINQRFAQKPRLPPCVLCQEDHGLFRCARFLILSLALRLAKVEQFNLCKACLGRHNISTCRFNIPCKHCKDGSVHNSTLCPILVNGATNAMLRTITTTQNESSENDQNYHRHHDDNLDDTQ